MGVPDGSVQLQCRSVQTTNKTRTHPHRYQKDLMKMIKIVAILCASRRRFRRHPIDLHVPSR